MKLAIILTNDWELFGNGQGDYFINQKEPLISLLKIVNSHQAKLTVFAEVIQQLNALLQASSSERLRDIASDWEKTITELVKQGHDVQLHIHPQLLENDLNYSNWSIANLPKSEMLDILSDCKKYLEKIIKKEIQNYDCLAFRAGGYAIQPSMVVIENLLSAGIKCDSSVTKGLFDSYYNFKHSYSYYFPWFCKSDVCLKQNANDSLLEIPIYSVPKMESTVLRVLFPQLYYLLFHSSKLSRDYRNWLKLKKQSKAKHSFKDLYSAEFKKSMVKLILSKIIQPSAMQFDYDKIPAKILLHYIKKKWNKIISYKLKNSEQFDNCYIPIVLIGHVKELHSTYNIEQFLELLNIELSGSYEFLTISEFYNNFISNSSLYNKLDDHLRSNGLL